MPKVQEYLPEQEAQGPVGRTEPMLDQVSMYGRGIEEAGRGVSDAYDILHQRQTQAEVSDTWAATSDAKAEYMDRITQARNDGSINDPNSPNSLDKIKQDYQDWSDKHYDTYDTAGGKNAFNRASARTGGMILQHATAASAQAAGFKAQQDLTTTMNNNSNHVLDNPGDYADTRMSQREQVQAQVDSGALTPSQAATQEKAMNLELAKSAVRGIYQQDASKITAAVVASGGKVDPTQVSNSAQKMMAAGGFDDVLDSTTKHGLLQEIKSSQSSAQSAGMQQLSMRQNAISAQASAAMSKAYVQIKGGTYDAANTTALVQKGVLGIGDAEQLNHIAEASGRQVSYSNPAQVQSLMGRIYSPDNAPGHIHDQSELTYMIGKTPEEFMPGSNKIGVSDYNTLADAIGMAKGPQRYAQGQLMDKATEAIGKDDGAPYRNGNFQQMVSREIQAAQKAGTPVGPLLDPASKDYLGNRLPQYMLSPPQALAAQANAVRGGAPPPADIKAQPGVIPPSPGMGSILKPGAADKMKADADEIAAAAKGAWNAAFPAAPKGQSGIDFASRYNGGAAPAAPKGPDFTTMNGGDLAKVNIAALSPAQKADMLARVRQLKAKR